MLRMLQVMSYMIAYLEYTKQEVEETFRALDAGELTQLELDDILGLEHSDDVMAKLFDENIPRWESALAVTMMRLEAA